MMITVRPSLRYSPLTISCEKRPDPSSPRRVAPFWLAVLLARSSSEVGLTLAPITTRNVLSIFAHPTCCFAEIYSAFTRIQSFSALREYQDLKRGGTSPRRDVYSPDFLFFPHPLDD